MPIAQQERLPSSVQEVADVIGREKALELVGKLPSLRRPSGTPGEQRIEVYIPMLCNLKPDHKLVRMIGYAAAERLCHRFSGEILQLATCKGVYRAFRDKAVMRALNDGATEAEASEWFGVSIKTVQLIARKHRIVERLCGKGKQ